MEGNSDPLVLIQGETPHASAALHDYALMELGGCWKPLRELHQSTLREQAGEHSALRNLKRSLDAGWLAG